MNFRRFLEIVRSPDNEDGAPEPIVAENALAGDVVVPEAEIAPEPEPEALPEPVVHGNKGKTPWYMDRINEETNKRANVEADLAKERRERQEAQSLLEKLQKGGDSTTHAARVDEQDIDALVEARAARKLFDADCNSAAAAWKKETGADFDGRMSVLGNVGLLPARDGSNTDFMMDIFAVDRENAHKILDLLSQDPDRALEMTRMDSRRRIAELTRMVMSQTEKPAPVPAPKPAAVSKVPAPKPVLEPAGGVAEVDEEAMSDVQWSAWRKKELAKQRA